jgi:CheY-like chemotaxis protein
MSNKTRVLNVRVVGFSAPERQMLNSIFLLSVAPARQIGYKLWNPEAGVAPDMYLLDGDSENAVASWQATFSSTADRTLVVGSKNVDLGVASAARPLGLKVVGAMDRLAIALSNATKESALHDVSGPRAGTLPTGGITSNDMSVPAAPKPDVSLPRVSTGATVQQPALSTSMNGPAPFSATAAGSTLSRAAAAAASAAPMNAADSAPMTASAPAATVLPHVTLQSNVPLEKPVTEKTVDRILSDKMGERTLDKPTLPPTGGPASTAPAGGAAALPPTSGATPLSPSALAAAVAPSSNRANLRVVSNATPPLSASLPASARIPDSPMGATGSSPILKQEPAVPAATAPVAAAPVAPPAPVAPIGTPTPRHEEHNFRVLAVDDSPLMRTFLQNKLQPYGINPEFASSGEEALFKISKNHFDMIFLDVMLPGMDGYDVCKMIKKNKDNHLMKVVMLTSKDKTFDKIRGTMAGCDGYLTKPVDELKLRAIIERHTVNRK